MTGETREVVLRVVPGNVVEGRVVDAETSQPIPDVTVEVRLDDGSESRPSLHLLTDAAGRYRLAGIPPGVIAIPFAWPTFEHGGGEAGRGWQMDEPGGPTAEDLRRAGRAVRFDGTGGHATLDHMLSRNPGVEIVCALRFPPGRHPPARVAIAHVTGPADPAAAAGERGSYWSLREIAPEAPEVRLLLPLGRSLVHIWAGDAEALLPPRVVARSGPPEWMEVELQPLPRVVAQLVDAAGNPIARAGVEVTVCSGIPGQFDGRPSTVGTTPTDADGRAELGPLLPPVRTCLASAASAEAAPVRRFYLVLRGEGVYPGDTASGAAAVLALTDIELRARMREVGPTGVVRLLARAARWTPIRLRVVLSDRTPLGGLRVVGLPREAFDGDGSAVSDADGCVELRYVGESRPAMAVRDVFERRIEIASEGWLGTLTTQDALAAPRDERRLVPGPKGPEIRVDPTVDASTRPVELVVVASRTVRLRLLDRRGHPCPGIEVQTHWMGTTGSVIHYPRADAAGVIAFAVERTDRELSVQIHRPGERGAIVTVPVPGSDAIVDCVLFTIEQSIRVLDAAGRPLDPQAGDAAYRATAFDGAGQPLGRIRGGSWSKREGAWEMGISAPAAARRLEIEFRGQTFTLPLPDGEPIEPPPEWRLR